MRSVTVRKVTDDAYLVVNNLSYFNQITRFDLLLATQTISATKSEPYGFVSDEMDNEDEPE